MPLRSVLRAVRLPQRGAGSAIAEHARARYNSYAPSGAGVGGSKRSTSPTDELHNAGEEIPLPSTSSPLEPDLLHQHEQGLDHSPHPHLQRKHSSTAVFPGFAASAAVVEDMDASSSAVRQHQVGEVDLSSSSAVVPVLPQTPVPAMTPLLEYESDGEARGGDSTAYTRRLELTWKVLVALTAVGVLLLLVVEKLKDIYVSRRVSELGVSDRQRQQLRVMILQAAKGQGTPLAFTTTPSDGSVGVSKSHSTPPGSVDLEHERHWTQRQKMLADKYMQELVDLFEAIAGKGKRFVTKEAWLSYERSQLSFVGAIQSCMNSSTEDQDILHWRMDLCKAICSAFDLNKDGQISFAEFVTAAVAFAAVEEDSIADADAHVALVFHLMDANGDGYVSESELQQFILLCLRAGIISDRPTKGKNILDESQVDCTQEEEIYEITNPSSNNGQLSDAYLEHRARDIAHACIQEAYIRSSRSTNRKGGEPQNWLELLTRVVTRHREGVAEEGVDTHDLSQALSLEDFKLSVGPLMHKILSDVRNYVARSNEPSQTVPRSSSLAISRSGFEELVTGEQRREDLLKHLLGCHTYDKFMN